MEWNWLELNVNLNRFRSMVMPPIHSYNSYNLNFKSKRTWLLNLDWIGLDWIGLIWVSISIVSDQYSCNRLAPTIHITLISNKKPNDLTNLNRIGSDRIGSDWFEYQSQSFRCNIRNGLRSIHSLHERIGCRPD